MPSVLKVLMQIIPCASLQASSRVRSRRYIPYFSIAAPCMDTYSMLMVTAAMYKGIVHGAVNRSLNPPYDCPFCRHIEGTVKGDCLICCINENTLRPIHGIIPEICLRCCRMISAKAVTDCRPAPFVKSPVGYCSCGQLEVKTPL